MNDEKLKSSLFEKYKDGKLIEIPYRLSQTIYVVHRNKYLSTHELCNKIRYNTVELKDVYHVITERYNLKEHGLDPVNCYLDQEEAWKNANIESQKYIDNHKRDYGLL